MQILILSTFCEWKKRHGYFVTSLRLQWYISVWPVFKLRQSGFKDHTLNYHCLYKTHRSLTNSDGLKVEVRIVGLYLWRTKETMHYLAHCSATQHSIFHCTDELALAFTLACPWPASTHNLTVSLWQEISVVWNSGNVVHLLVCTHLLKHAFLQPWCASVILLVELRGKLKCRNVNGVAACRKFSIHVAISYTGSKRHISSLFCWLVYFVH